MILQGSNNPIVFTFPENMSQVTEMEVGLFCIDTEFPCTHPYHSGAESFKEAKHWSFEDLTIENNIVYAPMTQEESILFPTGPCIIEIKWLDIDGKVNFAKSISSTVVNRFDKTIMNEE